MIYQGMFSDTFMHVEAASEEEAKEKLMQAFLLKVSADTDPFIVWEDNAANVEYLDKLPAKPLVIAEVKP